MNFSVRISVCILLLSMLACGTLEISVERTPTPDVVATGTVGALQAQNAYLSTKMAMLNPPAEIFTPTPLVQPVSPSVAPTESLPAATRDYIPGWCHCWCRQCPDPRRPVPELRLARHSSPADVCLRRLVQQ